MLEVSVALTLAVLSLLLVMKYDRSGESWISVIRSKCARSFALTSSPVFASKRATFPDSWPVRMREGMWAKAQTTALLPVGLKKDTGSGDSVYVSSVQGEHKSQQSAMIPMKERKTRRTVSPIALSVDIEHTNSALVAHSLLGNANDLVVILAKRYTLYGCWEFPTIQALAALYVPEAQSVVGRAGDKEARLSYSRFMAYKNMKRLVNTTNDENKESEEAYSRHLLSILFRCVRRMFLVALHCG